MEPLQINGSRETPSINCDANKGTIEIKGLSISEDPLIQTYKPILNWLEEYLNNCKQVTTVNIQLEYVNSASVKGLVLFFRLIKQLKSENEKAKIIINWYYFENDDDIQETGESFQDMIDIPFNFLEVKR